MEESKDISFIAKGAIIVFICIILGRLFSYLFTLLVARIGPQQYGALSISFSIIEFLFIFSLLGLNEGVERFVAYYSGKRDNSKAKGIIFDTFLFSGFLSILFSIIFFVF